MNGADLLVKCLEKEEVDVVFGYPGVAICPFYNSILSSEVKTVLKNKKCGKRLAFLSVKIYTKSCTRRIYGKDI